MFVILTNRIDSRHQLKSLELLGIVPKLDRLLEPNPHGAVFR